ncbi:polyphosphate kinase 2 [Cohaesibacter celericrescens]|uniref:ADP/GDP-polyphosphate phosphotransferase n=1 Tax=Cohaesibacter celericrescens TaxID=2067669 RepID=A0A2N5XUD9_9HYPH|nr:polyphosphate kinase 2 [Cohaesibacter celericrescens]PLW78090.1 polyphosphate kinase 2 [Cohaesibacter celericrescens]
MSVHFDLEDPEFPKELEDIIMESGGYPYDKKLKRSKYEDELERLQIELVKVQEWVRETGERIVCVFEGRDAAGKGGSIKVITQYTNPRHVRVVALSKPSDVEQGQWYFQRYAKQLPTSGEIVLFDRSWYNRAGVEPVMGFSTQDQTDKFLKDAPRFEQMILDSGTRLFKFWLNVGREMQLRRFHDRRHSLLKHWKLSPIDLKALDKWDDYTQARDKMLISTHRDRSPWVVIRSNDKRRARINMLRYFLGALDYPGKDLSVLDPIDPKILGFGLPFLHKGE